MVRSTLAGVTLAGALGGSVLLGACQQDVSVGGTGGGGAGGKAGTATGQKAAGTATGGCNLTHGAVPCAGNADCLADGAVCGPAGVCACAGGASASSGPGGTCALGHDPLPCTSDGDCAAAGALCGGGGACVCPAGSAAATGTGGASGVGSSGPSVVSATSTGPSGVSATSTVSGTGGSGVGFCTPLQQQQRWAQLSTSLISPPGHGAGLDLSQHPTPVDAQTMNCDFTAVSNSTGFWGPSGSEIAFSWDPATQLGYELDFFPGFQGRLEFKGSVPYEVVIGDAVRKNGQPFLLEPGWQGPTFAAELDELYRALTATYLPNAPPEPQGVLCTASDRCATAVFGAMGSVLFRPVGLALWVQDVNGTPTQASSIIRIGLVGPT